MKALILKLYMYTYSYMMEMKILHKEWLIMDCKLDLQMLITFKVVAFA